MLRKALYGVGMAVLLSALFVFTVVAQTPDTEEAVVDQPVIEPILASLVQSVPVTLTLSVPGPEGTQTIQVPIVLSFDIQVGISNQITTSVVVTAVDVTAGSTDSAESAEAESVPDTAEGALTPTPARIGIVPTATAGSSASATAVAATATPAPTPTSVATPEAEDTAEPEPEGEETDTPTPDEPAGEDADAPESEATAEATAEATEEAVEEGTEETAPEEGATEPVFSDACANPETTITSPAAGQIVSGTVRIEGTAMHANFDYYKMEYDIVGDDAENFVYFDGTETQVTAALLGNLDSEELPNGPLTVRLTVVDGTGNFPPPCEVTFVIGN